MPPHASGMPRSTSGIEKYASVAAIAEIARRGEHQPAADAVAVDAGDRDRVHRFDRVGHQTPEVGVVARGALGRCVEG